MSMMAMAKQSDWLPPKQLSNFPSYLAFTLTLGLALLFARAWPRLAYPEVWAEDGTQNLPGFFANGFGDLFSPLNGYLVLVSKIISITAASLSITYYPLTSTILAWAVALFVFCLIAWSPLFLRGQLLLAIAYLLVPSNPEVYGLPLYTFWLVSVLLFILPFWDPNRPYVLLRATITVIASLSSPACIIVVPLLVLRAIHLRERKGEVALALVAVVCAGLQAWTMLSFRGLVTTSVPYDTLELIIPRFLGSYLVGNLASTLESIAGIALLIFLAISVYRQPRSIVMWCLLYLWAGAVFMTLTRVGFKIHHELYGPRYFFYPFILLSWLLIQCALSEQNRVLRSISWGLLLLAAVNAVPVLGRTHDRLDWRGHLETCQHFANYSIPIHYDGAAPRSWSLRLSQSQCVSLLSRDHLYRSSGAHPRTYPATVSDFAENIPKRFGVSARVLDIFGVNEWNGSDFERSAIDGLRIVGSHVSSDADIGSLTLRLRRGDTLLFRSGPTGGGQTLEVLADGFIPMLLPIASEWRQLDFSNDLLPESFLVRFTDQGKGWGEWSAVALRID